MFDKINEVTQTPITLLEGAQLKKLSNLLDASFPVNSGSHFFDDFPVWEVGSGVLRYGVFEGETLTSAAGLRVCKLRVEGKELPVGLIGAVVTDSRYRKQGLAGNLISHLVEVAKTKGCAAAFLWGSEHTLYQKYGFEVCGYQKLFELSEFLKSAQLEVKGANFQGGIFEGFDPQIFELQKKRKTGLAFSQADYFWIEKHKNVKWVSVREKGIVRAYLGFGRGIDMPGIIHEWGHDGGAGHGNDSSTLESLRALTFLFQKFLEHEPSAKILAGPGLGFFKFLEDLNQYPEILALGSILQPKKLAEIFQISDEVFKGLSQKEILNLMWGPLPASLEHLKTQGTQVFPKPLWFWGLDAV